MIPQNQRGFLWSAEKYNLSWAFSYFQGRCLSEDVFINLFSQFEYFIRISTSFRHLMKEEHVLTVINASF